MLTATYKSVLDGALKRRGVTPAQAQTERLAQVAEFIADFLRDAWEYYPWPETVVVEERFYRAAWTATAYNAADEVYHADTDKYWVANDAAADTDVPGVSALWDEMTSFRKTIAWEQAGEEPIEAATGAWDADPLADPEALPVAYALSVDGLEIDPGHAATSVWLKLRRRAPDFAWGEIWDSTATYAVGDRVYFGSEVYVCAEATTAAQSPTTHSAKWTLVEFPLRLARAVKVAAAAADQGAGGQEDKKQAAQGEFAALLDEQVYQLTTVQGQRGRVEVAV